MSPITVYTKPACVQCDATCRALEKVICVSRADRGTFVIGGLV
jgi:glutaredoxin